jgi:hypothetical protein
MIILTLSMAHMPIKLFRVSAGIILAITGMAKVVTVLAGHAKLFDVADPIIGVHFRYLMFGAGALELAVASVCFSNKLQTLTLTLIAWLAISLLIYRVGIWGEGWHRPCSCLGNLTDAIHVSPQIADNIMKGVLAYLFIGSYGILLNQFLNKRKFANGKLDLRNSKIKVGG